jgi:hypothetical protein
MSQTKLKKQIYETALGEAQAFPGQFKIGDVYEPGLTIRQKFAESAFAALLAKHGVDDYTPDYLAEEAVNHADALIAALNKPQPK